MFSPSLQRVANHVLQTKFKGSYCVIVSFKKSLLLLTKHSWKKIYFPLCTSHQYAALISAQRQKTLQPPLRHGVPLPAFQPPLRPSPASHPFNHFIKFPRMFRGLLLEIIFKPQFFSFTLSYYSI